MRSVIDWSAVDWRKSSASLAAELNVDITTVARWRVRVGQPSTALRKPRKDIGISRPYSKPLARAVQPIATAAAQKSPKAGRGTDNIHAVDWMLVAPDGEQYRVRNLYEFVRANTHLFAEADVVWKRTGGKRGTGGEWCNATAGILNIKGGRAKSWKGWRLG